MSFLVRKLKLSKYSYHFQEWQNFLIMSQKKRYCTAPDGNPPEDSKENFRVLRVLPPPKPEKPPEKPMRKRYEDIEVEAAEWSSIWVGPKSFDCYMVPLPLRQGFVNNGAPLEKYANAELMKIPNFLHLTPPAVEKHCNAIKKFCTKWPEELTTEEKMDNLFPVTIVATDYCNSLPTIRDPLARIITLKIKITALGLNKHARDKFLRLVGDRYDPKTGYVTLTVENCPLKKQNYDYAMYLLTALYFESWKVEDWESSKSRADMEEYIYKNREAKTNIDSYFAYNNEEVPKTDKLEKVTENYINIEENSDIIKLYKEAVMEVLQLPQFNSDLKFDITN